MAGNGIRNLDKTRPFQVTVLCLQECSNMYLAHIECTVPSDLTPPSVSIFLRIKSTRYFLQKDSLNFNDLKACYFTTPRDEFHFLFASFLKCRSAY